MDTAFAKFDFETRMAFSQAVTNARDCGDKTLSLALLAAALASAPSVATAVLDLDALLHELGSGPCAEVDFGTQPGMRMLPLDERAKKAFAAVEADVQSASDASVRPARVLRIFAEADPELRAILDRNDLPEDVLRAAE